MQNGKLDFRQLDGTEFRGKSKMTPLELSLILDSAANVIPYRSGFACLRLLRTTHLGAKVEWFRCVPYLLIHGLVPLLSFIHLCGPALSFVSFPTLLGCLLLLLFYHRYFSHRAFKTNE